MNSWQTVGNINPQSFTETRLQLHYAIQFMATAFLDSAISAARSLLGTKIV